MSTSSPAKSPFLNLPLEIRNSIYIFLLVKKDWIREEYETLSDWSDSAIPNDSDDYSSQEVSSSASSNASNRAASSSVETTNSLPELVHEAIIVGELHPSKYSPKTRRSPYWTKNWDRNVQTEQRTTYSLNSDVDLRIFGVCRQTYDEATYIFYSQNRFYMESIEVLFPFLADRTNRALALLHSLSIPVPCGTQRDEEGERIQRYYRVNNVTFDKACGQVFKESRLLAGVKHLDLRMWDFETNWRARSSPDVDTIKISTNRAKQLASLADPRMMTLSFYDWHATGSEGPSSHAVLQRMPVHLCRKIARFRVDFVPGMHDEGLDDQGNEDENSERDDDNDDGDHYTSWRDILMGRRDTNAI